MGVRTLQLRETLRKQGTVMAPGAYDGVSAKIVERLGFEVVYVSGYCVEASRLGFPDIGLASMNEVVDQARNIAEAVSIPIVCDSDTGYGGVTNIARTVKCFVKAGVAGIHLEDQTIPKRCGGLSGRRVVSPEEMVSRIKVAVDSREDDDFIIIARTDAKGVLGGVEYAIERAKKYIQAGADLVMIAERYDIEELKKLAKEVEGRLVIVGGMPGWPETNLPFSKYEEWGVKIVIYPVAGLYAAAKAIGKLYQELKNEKSLHVDYLNDLCMGFDEFNRFIGLPYWSQIEEKYSSIG